MNIFADAIWQEPSESEIIDKAASRPHGFTRFLYEAQRGRQDVLRKNKPKRTPRAMSKAALKRVGALDKYKELYGEVPPKLNHWCLYRIWNGDGQLLYVGMTGNFGLRVGAHARDKKWWPEVMNITLEHFNDSVTLREAELRAIAEENPMYNKADRPESYYL